MTEGLNDLDHTVGANREEPVVETVVAEKVEPEQNKVNQDVQNSSVKNTESVLALVFGILSLFSSGIFSIPALIFANKAKNYVLNSTEKSMATAGKVLAIVSIVIFAILFLFYFMFFLMGFFYGMSDAAPPVDMML